MFVQIGDENVHLVRSLMDEVFGSENFVSLITFKTTSGFTQSAALPRDGDYLVWFARDAATMKYRTVYRPRTLSDDVGARYRRIELPDGTRRPMTRIEMVTPPAGEVYRHDNLTSQGATPSGTVEFQFEGHAFHPGPGSHWKTTTEGLRRLGICRRLAAPTKNSLAYVRYLNDFPVREFTNTWLDTQTGAFTDDKVYVVQTNSKIIERCMLMTTDPGDLVLDPTCGSGTTAQVAEQWGRRWITIDTSRVALALTRQRIMGARHPYYLLADSEVGRAKESALSGAPLPPATVRDDIRHGFVYERVQHVTLKSIANNPDIVEGMTQADIEAAIKRHAEFEQLIDRPYEDKKKIRVAGPFTVESLSPHRSLGFAGSAVGDGGAVNTDTVPDPGDGDAAFEQSIMANLQAAGIQNGRKKERLELDSVESYAGAYIQAVATREQAEEGTPKRIGVTIGPQYGTVGPAFVKDAAREAIKDADLDLLCVLAFAFDPQVLGAQAEYAASADDFAEVAAERRLGRIPVLLVRMNADLVMGDELKKTGAGNLFTVFGEPDVEIETVGDELRVVLRGVDVYDPNTGELRSDDTGQIALWMVDSAYDGESFFVRHCYFTGNQKPYERLKKALQAEIDEDAWAELYGTTSRLFPRPESGRIAIKVINDYGDEEGL